MRLIGAREFLRTVKAGTLFAQFWMDSEEECLEIIKDYENGLSIEKILSDRYKEFAIFGDNSGSLTFLIPSEDDISDCEAIIKGKKYNCLFYYDLNIYGDASPTETLYLVFDSEDEYPESIEIKQVSDDKKYLNKEDIINIRQWFLKECGPFHDETKPGIVWFPLKRLEEMYPDDNIVNYKSKERKNE